MQIIDKLSISPTRQYDASAQQWRTQAQFRGQEWSGLDQWHGHLPQLYAGRRCVSLLKILLTNFCLYHCQYCVNRRSSDVPRARFTTEEVVALTMDFYRRNCVSGRFSVRGYRSADYTMEQLFEWPNAP